jgi:hypothetical protein
MDRHASGVAWSNIFLFSRKILARRFSGVIRAANREEVFEVIR